MSTETLEHLSKDPFPSGRNRDEYMKRIPSLLKEYSTKMEDFLIIMN